MLAVTRLEYEAVYCYSICDFINIEGWFTLLRCIQIDIQRLLIVTLVIRVTSCCVMRTISATSSSILKPFFFLNIGFNIIYVLRIIFSIEVTITFSQYIYPYCKTKNNCSHSWHWNNFIQVQCSNRWITETRLRFSLLKI